MTVAVIDYNAGNTRSVSYALQRLRVDALFTNDLDKIRSADKVIFPGVGEANSTMRYLNKIGLDELIPSLTQPVLGVCLGMQLMCRWSEENDTPCLNIFDVDVKRFQPAGQEKVPHMGWNRIYQLDARIFDLDLEGEYAYFVHSYYVPANPCTTALCDYIHPFSAAISRDNFYATQFHPEKSGPVGARIIQTFLDL